MTITLQQPGEGEAGWAQKVNTNFGDIQSAINNGVPGAYLQTTYLTSGTSFTTTLYTNKIRLRMVGGGGGGGGAKANTVPGGAAGAGGGAGTYAEKTFSVAPSTSYTYAIGAGGTAGAGVYTGGNAGNGGSTTFTVGGTTVTAPGGNGGGNAWTVNSGSANPAWCAAAGSANSAATNADLSVPGSGATAPLVTNTYAWSGVGGASPFGSPGAQQIANGGANQGNNATGYGAGGSGAACQNSNTGATGGTGAPGLIIVDEFA